MEKDTMIKYAAGGVILGSLFYLVLIDKVSAELYVQVCFAALAALGIHAATGVKK